MIYSFFISIKLRVIVIHTLYIYILSYLLKVVPGLFLLFFNLFKFNNI